MSVAASCSRREKLHLHKFHKMSHILPLYAFDPKKHDTNPPKMSHILPLYAFDPKKHDTNPGKLGWDAMRKNVTVFPLICEMAGNSWHKCPKNDHSFSPYMQIGPEIVTRIDENVIVILTQYFPLICVLAKNCWHKSTKIDPVFSPYMRFGQKLLT